MKAENYTCQEAGCFWPRRGQEIRGSEWDPSRYTHARVHTSTHTYMEPGCPFSGVQAGAIEVCACVSVSVWTTSLSTLFFPFFPMLEAL